MPPCLCIGGGASCDPLSAGTTTQQFVTGFGYQYNSSDPNQATYAAIIKANTPPALIGGKFAAGFASFAEACLRTRAALFCNKTPGDCGGPPSFGGNTQLASLANIGQLSHLGLSTGTTIAGLLGVGGTAFAGATLGAGLALTAILTIFQNHAKAVQAQANALCTLCPAATNAIQQIDAAVASGQATPAQAVAALGSVASSFRSSTQSLTKSCNAFCAYNAILAMQAAYAPYLYGVAMQLQPVNIVQPVSTARAVVPGTVSDVVAAPQTIIGLAPQVSTNPISPSSQYYGATGPTGSFENPGNTIGFGNNYSQPLLTEVQGLPPQVAQTSQSLVSAIPSWLWIVVAALGAYLFFSRSEVAA